MGHRLLLLRHAKSSWDDPSLPDHDRLLSKRGRKAAAAMRDVMRSKRFQADLVLVSAARRTVDTFDALHLRRKARRVDVQEALYLAHVPRMLELLHEVGESVRSVLLIGHNPGLQELAMSLCAGQPKPGGGTMARRLAKAFPTAALAAFDVSCPWTEIGEGSGTLTHLVVPRKLTRG